mmetsp:Transcript_27418/g.62965  ORF Transcript_27418/g.62965 Transcript_27418/m.62965 type:complete len:286 (-) Transcript_27418:132-989(-)
MQSVMTVHVTRRQLLSRLLLPIALVVTPRPDPIGRGHVGGPTEITQQPDGRPQPSDVRIAGKDHFHLHDAAGETKLVPALEHARNIISRLFVYRLVDGILREPRRFADASGDIEVSPCGRDRGRVVIMQRPESGIVHDVIVLVQSGPRGIVAVRKRATVYVEFVGHHQTILRAVDETGGRMKFGWGIRIDPCRPCRPQGTGTGDGDGRCHDRGQKGFATGNDGAPAERGRHGVSGGRHPWCSNGASKSQSWAACSASKLDVEMWWQDSLRATCGVKSDHTTAMRT